MLGLNAFRILVSQNCHDGNCACVFTSSAVHQERISLVSNFCFVPVGLRSSVIIMSSDACLHISKTRCPKYQILYACYLWPWHGPPLSTLQYVTILYFVDDIQFAHISQTQVRKKGVCSNWLTMGQHGFNTVMNFAYTHQGQHWGNV